MKTTLTSLKLSLLAATVIAGVNLDAQIYPVVYSNYTPGPTADFIGSIPSQRSNPNNALGAPQINDTDMGETAGNSATVNFVSLGFGGSIDLTFAQPFGQCQGADLDIIETSYGTPACSGWQEYADVFVSQDGCNWVQVADNQCQNFSVELPASMPWAMYVRIVDASPAGAFASNADGYDVDGVRANCTSNMAPLADPTAPRFADAYSNYISGSLKGNPASLPAANRMNPNNALGSATGSDAPATPVFVSLGFDKTSTPGIQEGQITLEFFATLFDRPGHDIRVFETTFNDGGSIACVNYPEIAEFYGSNDGVNWTLLANDGNEPSDASLGGPGRLCRDGWLEISGMPGGTLRFLKIIDKSIKSSNKFPSTADGYDIDGVYGFGCDADANAGRYGFVDQNNFPDEDGSVFLFGVFPNPASSVITVNLETSSANQDYVIKITDVTGRIVSSEILNVAANSNINHDMNVESLPSAVYIVTVEAGGYKQISRIVKN